MAVVPIDLHVGVVVEAEDEVNASVSRYLDKKTTVDRLKYCQTGCT